MHNSTARFVFFGTPHLAVIVLEQLKAHSLTPACIVTAPDKPAGRGMQVAESAVALWARAHGIHTLKPERFDDATIAELAAVHADVFVVVAYGKILKQAVLDIPPHGILNVHPSLLPKLRGPSPVRSAVLHDEQTTGVTIMQIDEKMDHGPILAQETHTPTVWPPEVAALETHLFTRGGQLLAEVLPRYMSGEIEPREQEHAQATYTVLFTKEDGLLDLTQDAYQNLLKIHAYAGWPGAYFFTEHGTRVKVLSAHIENNSLVLDEVVPEGKKAMPYSEFLTHKR